MKFCATTGLTRAFLTHFRIFNESQAWYYLQTVEALLIGRLLLRAPSARKIHREMAQGSSIVTWYRCIKLIAETSFDYVECVFQLHENGLVRMDQTGVFIIDGHVIPHLGKHMEGVSKAYSSIEKHPILGLETEMVHYWSPTMQFPVDYRIFLAESDLCITRKKATFKTKNELVREMIEALIKRNVETDLYLLDAGLGVKDTLKVIIRYVKKYVTRPKKNFGVTFNHKYQFLTDLFEDIPIAEFQPATVKNPITKQQHVYSTAIRDVYMSGLGTQRLVFIDESSLPAEEEADTKPTEELKTLTHRKFRVFMTNQLQWDAQEILSRYSLRWTIETSFRDENQNIGFHECKFCLYAHQKLFLGITCLSYLFLAWARANPILRRFGDLDSTFGEVNFAFQHYCQDEFYQYLDKIGAKTTCPDELNCLKTILYNC